MSLARTRCGWLVGGDRLAAAHTERRSQPGGTRGRIKARVVRVDGRWKVHAWTDAVFRCEGELK